MFFLDLLLFLAPVSIAITGLGADFTRLESFGKVGEFAETLVGFAIFCFLSTRCHEQNECDEWFGIFCRLVVWTEAGRGLPVLQPNL